MACFVVFINVIRHMVNLYVTDYEILAVGDQLLAKCDFLYLSHNHELSTQFR